MACEYEVQMAPFVKGIGQPMLILVTNKPDGTKWITVEWYLLVRSHQDAISHTDSGSIKNGANDDPNDESQPTTAEQLIGSAVGLAKNSFTEHQVKKTKVESELIFKEIEFETVQDKKLVEWLFGGAGRSEFEAIKAKTHCQKFSLFLLNSLTITRKVPESH